MKRAIVTGIMAVGLGLVLLAVLMHLTHAQVRPDLTPGELVLIVLGGLIAVGLSIFEGRNFER